MKAIELATTHKVTESYISHLRHNRKFTDNLDLAVGLAELTGKKPIDYVSRRIRKYVLSAHPEFGRKIKKAVV